MRKSLLISLLMFVAFTGKAQTGVAGGATLVKGIGYSGVYSGIHLGVEIPRDDMVSFFGRIITTLPNSVNDSIRVEAIDPTTTFPSTKYVPCKFSNSVFNIQAGTRYYLGNGYDYGLSAYGGSIFELATLGVRKKSDAYDETKYQFISSSGTAYTNKGRTIAVSLGLNAGIKYNTYFGVLYFDITGSYSLFGIGTNALATDYSRYSPLNVTFNLGFRKDIF